MKRLTIIITCFLISVISYGQTILNAYAKVSAINVGATTLTVTNVNETSHTFTVGGDVIIMQMQDNCIGTNTTNASTFGDLGTIANAGRYEIRKIVSRLPATGTPTSITLDFALTYTFNTGTNSSVQLATFRNLGANYTTTANITGLSWDGNIGGIIAIQVTNTLTLSHSISADFIGFRGGAKSNDADEACSNTFFIGNDANKAYKGEGIYKSTNANFLNGLAKILTGGGGGSQNNAGGGGGANFTSGGNGGLGWTCTVINSGRGFGGVSLSSVVSSTRFFMGGGGGGGQQNNGVGTSGGNGGGIIFIKANTLMTNTICTSPIKISANGQSILLSGNDGAGGGGAAGSILLQINNFSITTTCSLAVNGNGGTGGTVNSGPHGGGGGGGQGIIIYSANQPTVNVTTTTNNGLAGWDNSDGTVINATSGGGTNNSGIFSSSVTPLPIDLISFSASCNNTTESVNIEWVTATEKNNAVFIIEKSVDALNWFTVKEVKGAGNSLNLLKYKLEDFDLSTDYVYYRLTQVDFDYQQKIYQNIVFVENCFKNKFEFEIYPNPTSGIIYLKNAPSGYVKISNAIGEYIESVLFKDNEINLGHLVNGIYFITSIDKSGREITRKFSKTDF